jgi:tRNA dimethylallyltransferase
VYRALDIASNKVTQQEARGVPHYLIDVAEPTAQYDIRDFHTQATQLVRQSRRVVRMQDVRVILCWRVQISSLSAQGKLPVIVGGTFYWIESLLWDSFLTSNAQQQPRQQNASSNAANSMQPESAEESDKSDNSASLPAVKAAKRQRDKHTITEAECDKVLPTLCQRAHSSYQWH